MQNPKEDQIKFYRNTSHTSSSSSARSNNGQEHCRKKLKSQFDECLKAESSSQQQDVDIQEKSVLSVLNLSETRKYLRNGAERISRTFNNVRVTFGSISQRFRSATRRRQILQEGPMTPNTVTPSTRTRLVLGRTPTKLYSPFGIDSPYHPTTINKENVPCSTELVKL